MTAPATPRELFDLWAEVRLQGLPPPALVRHALVAAHLRRLPTEAPDLFQVEEVGRSVEGRSLNLVRTGTGPRHILLWSQMHGDEPTATTALLDLFEYLRRYREHPRVARLLSALTLHALPMLNPDGAERFQRRNAQGIDINRDALALQTPEGRTLKALRDRLQPSLGFNLHNQSWRTAVGGTGRPASISLLAPAFDATRGDNPGRVLAKKVCAVIRDALEPLAPGQLGRYDDSFEVRAFGDNLVRWGTPTVLIETGPWPSPEPDEPLLRLNFVALVSALESLASGAVELADLARYESIPFNDSKGMLHLVIRGAHVFGEAGEAFVADIGVAAAQAVRTREGTASVVLSGSIEELGDLRVYGAVEGVDGAGLTVVPLPPGGVKEGDLLPLPPRSGRELRVGLPAELMLLRPVVPSGTYRVERIIRYER
ncbi:M14 metallopeptidase family protein [Vitiosangium sp. GDMCC 1.1324]|uniref:M14 family metallopeptidase n=1 Tax=Vitiosangium sp. (strain GDMCC 1.1324) TaxID=2138576 RepID=UPI000D3955FE|nr:M14 metallopeptidase family protein [Vitiosangium sp. GDMCC 1.1324]PTL78930.1 peptidase M14 [Vitiosangium sp. GDMCC 1.1324]